MNITILSTAYPLRGGIAHFVGLLYNELSQKHNVRIKTFKRQYPKIFFPGKSQTEQGDTVEKLDSEVVIDSVNPFNWLMAGLNIMREKPDLLIFKYWMSFFGPCFGVISRLAKLNGHTKVLVIVDNAIPHERKVWDIPATKFFFSSADYFVCMSKVVMEDLYRLKPAAKCILSFHPVYSNFGATVPKAEAKHKLGIQGERTILFFGFIREYKGLDVLLKAVRILKERLPLKLIIAGEFYSNEEKYRSMIKAFGIEEEVTVFSDFIPTSEVKYYFSACDAVVLPYKDATQSGIVQIANNFGKAVIATNVGGLSETIKNGVTGFLVEKENPESLASAIEFFYKEGCEEKFSGNVLEEAGKYSWSRFANELTEFAKR